MFVNCPPQKVNIRTFSWKSYGDCFLKLSRITLLRLFGKEVKDLETAFQQLLQKVLPFRTNN